MEESTYHKVSHYCRAVLQSAGQVLGPEVSVCSWHLDSIPLVLFQHVQASQRMVVAQDQVRSPRRTEYEGQMTQTKTKVTNR